MRDHAARSTEEACPLLHQFMAMDMDERWVARSPMLDVDLRMSEADPVTAVSRVFRFST
jgi:hypothetical protein